MNPPDADIIFLRVDAYNKWRANVFRGRSRAVCGQTLPIPLMSILSNSQIAQTELTPLTTWLSMGFCPFPATHAGLSELGKGHSRFESHLYLANPNPPKRQRRLSMSRRPPG